MSSRTLTILGCAAGLVMMLVMMLFVRAELDRMSAKVDSQTKEGVRAGVEAVKDELLNTIPDVGLPIGKPKKEKDGNKSSEEEEEEDKSTVSQPTEMVTEMFKIGHKITRDIDDRAQEILKLSPEEERKVGKEIRSDVIKEYPLAPAALQAQASELLQPILQANHLSSSQYEVNVIESDDLNAFAVMGGQIFVTTKLIDFCKNDEELQFVLAHEVGHIALGHCRSAVYAARASQVAGGNIGMLADLAYQSVQLGYSEDKENAADDFAAQTMLKLNISLDHAININKRLAIEMEEEPDEEKGDDVVTRSIFEVQEHLRSHPNTHERVKRLETTKAQSSKGSKGQPQK